MRGEKFTQGPWMVDPAKLAGNGLRVCDSENRNIVFTGAYRRGHPECWIEADEAAANAHLIAAAPELYEALAEAKRLVDVDAIRVRDTERAMLMDWLEKAASALAKARGEA